jgi:hypothetical protein
MRLRDTAILIACLAFMALVFAWPIYGWLIG